MRSDLEVVQGTLKILKEYPHNYVCITLKKQVDANRHCGTPEYHSRREQAYRLCDMFEDYVYLSILHEADVSMYRDGPDFVNENEPGNWTLEACYRLLLALDAWPEGRPLEGWRVELVQGWYKELCDAEV